MDVSDEAQVSEAIARLESDFGPIAGLVNSAGIGRDVPFLETDAALLRRILEVNLVGSFVVAREAARRMRDRGRGSIVNIASVSGIRGNAGRAAYGLGRRGDADPGDGGGAGRLRHPRERGRARADRDAAGEPDAHG
ncbi:SDR family oxidoreductase [Achromobacter xylosoxidans]